jgi:AAA domain
MDREDINEIVDLNHVETRQRIEQRVADLLIEKEAKRRLAEASNKYDVPTFRVIDSIPDRPKWRIEDLISTGAYVMIAAQKKVGKTTLVLNLINALISGGMFLGKFRTFGQSKVGLVDFEMSEYHLADWLKKSGLLGDDRLVVMPLRGQAKALGILDDDRREKFIQQLQDHAVDVLIIDPLGPLLRSYGIDENDNTMVGQVIDLISEVAVEAGVSEVIVVHHHGKDDDKGARGASVLGDTPTSTWSLKKDDRTKLRSISIIGREGDDMSFRLAFDADTKALTHLEGDDHWSPPDNIKAILDALEAATEPLSGRELWERAKLMQYSSNREACMEDLKELRDQDRIKSIGQGTHCKWTSL